MDAELKPDYWFIGDSTARSSGVLYRSNDYVDPVHIQPGQRSDGVIGVKDSRSPCRARPLVAALRAFVIGLDGHPTRQLGLHVDSIQGER